ncbi:helix-turn-helix domain-containing protein [Actinomadura rugatobispora]|uniref:Helix-turn-helix domain-containing protein n=1 Tax=Actinomadura rugatobispora TaxID=1994 RepID=A0ABW0ZQS7_9ACTN|nr:helix-turn-helix domain-containing protein [Actinomadura rugatobispora]
MDVVTTAGVSAEDRFAMWHEVSSKMWVPLEVLCEPNLENKFHARAGFARLGLVEVALLTSTPLSVHRTPKLIRQSDPEDFLVTFAVRGRVFGEQDGRCAALRAGDLILRDSSRPCLTRFAPEPPAAQSLAMRFPRSSLPLPERGLRDLTCVRVPGDRGIGALSSQFLLQLARQMAELSPADTARLSTVALDVLTVALAGALDAHSALPLHTRRRALLAQIHAFIHDNLDDPHLTPGAIAAAHHISLRYLHALFRAEELTVAGWIRRRRLERCRRDLADPGLAARPISAIAARWGFSGPAHFSQVFRAAYGLSPRQFRQEYTLMRTD